MSDTETWTIIFVFAILALVTLSAWRNWLKPGVASAILYALAGAGIILLLGRADIPPWWFDGSAGGFLLGATFVVSAFLGKERLERAFRLPFLLGLGAALLAFNVWAHV